MYVKMDERHRVLWMYYVVNVVNDEVVMRILLIEEVPTDADTQASLIGRIMRGEEVVASAAVDVAVHHVETCLLEVEIRINVDPWIVTNLHAVVSILHRIHSHHRGIGRSIVLCEIADIGADIGAKNMGYVEVEIEIGPSVELWQGQNFVVGALLEGEFVFPNEGTELEVLAEGCRKELHVLVGLCHIDAITHLADVGPFRIVDFCPRLFLLEEGVVLDGLES